MSTHKRAESRDRNRTAPSDILSIMESSPSESEKEVGRQKGKFIFKRSHSYAIGGLIVILLLGVGIMASNGWLPSTDPLSGKRTGWFGKEMPKNASSSWNPVAAVLPTATPTPLPLSKENIYAGSRLLSVVDSNAQETPPADLAVWRPATNSVWFIMGAGNTIAASASWGTTNDVPKPGDYDGDGKTDFCVYRPSDSTWYIIYSSTGTYAGIAFGATGDKLAPADYDGDGKTDVAVYRQSDGHWYISRSSDSTLYAPQFGVSTDLPAPADYDGDGKADITVWRLSNTTFYTTRSSDSTLQSAVMSFTGYTLGSGDWLLPGDYDGDGRANYMIRNGASWLMLDSSLSNTTPITPTGDGATDLATDTPVPNDYDGDGKCDIAVWRDSNGDWYIRKSGNSNSLRQDHWGQSGDKPVPAYFRR